MDNVYSLAERLQRNSLIYLISVENAYTEPLVLELDLYYIHIYC